jgi:hypothetical protein
MEIKELMVAHEKLKKLRKPIHNVNVKHKVKLPLFRPDSHSAKNKRESYA